MFERFTNRARRVLVLAQEEAAALDHSFIGTEHVLLGLLHEGEGVGAKALTELGLDLATIRSKVEATIGRGEPDASAKKVPFTPRAKKVLELSLREALMLGHNYIGTEHLLLGLIHEGEGVASQVLVDAGLRPDQVRAKVVELLRGYSPTPAAPPAGGWSRSTRSTPAGTAIPAKALEHAGIAPIASQHYLLALFDDPQSLGARVLESLGVTRAAVVDRITAMGVSGTTDEMPMSSPQPSFDLGLGDGFTLRIEDSQLAEQLKAIADQKEGEAGDSSSLAALIRKALADHLAPPTAIDEEPE